MLLRIVKVATGFIEGDRGDLCGRQSARGPGAIARHYRVRYGTVVDEGNRCACAHPGPIRIESVLIQAKTSSVRRLVLVRQCLDLIRVLDPPFLLCLWRPRPRPPLPGPGPRAGSP